MLSHPALLASLLVATATAQQQDVVTEIDPEKRDAVVLSLADLIEEKYVFEDVGFEIAEKLRQQLISGAYDNLTHPGALAGALTRDLQSVNDDRHLNVRPLRTGTADEPDISEAEARARYLERSRRANYGFQRVEILPGNIGYLDLRQFADARIGGPTAVAAMAFLANTDALVIDLRQNGGGNPSMIQLLMSYFLAEPTHLNSFEWRGEAEMKQFWSLPHVPGKRMVDVPLYVLTSSNTFSAAEEFSYNVRNLERATLIGETTGGGAHPGDTFPVEGVFSVFIAGGRAVNPITGTNWEGVGVVPHVPVPAPQALDVAIRQANEAIQARKTASAQAVHE